MKMPDHIKKLFADAYRYREKYLEPENTERFWIMASEEMQEIVNNHNNSQFAQEIMLACYDNINNELLYRRSIGILSAQEGYE